MDGACHICTNNSYATNQVKMETERNMTDGTDLSDWVKRDIDTVSSFGLSHKRILWIRIIVGRKSTKNWLTQDYLENG